jgi:hypothetical protein
MGRNPLTGPVITYELIQSLTDLSMNALHQAGGQKVKPHRQRLDLGSLESVVLWLAGHGKRELRIKMCGLAAQALLGDGDQCGAPKKVRRRAKRS